MFALLVGQSPDSGPTSTDEAAAEYRRCADGIRRVLELADEAVVAGDPKDAAELLLGILSDLKPRLAVLARFSRTP